VYLYFVKIRISCYESFYWTDCLILLCIYVVSLYIVLFLFVSKFLVPKSIIRFARMLGWIAHSHFLYVLVTKVSDKLEIGEKCVWQEYSAVPLTGTHGNSKGKKRIERRRCNVMDYILVMFVWLYCTIALYK